MNILVLGSSGMIGHMVSEQIEKQGHSVTNVSRSSPDVQLNFSSDYGLEKIIEIAPNFDFVVNCSGILISDCNSSLSDALKINALLPNLLSAALSGTTTRLIQISTDCVFSGQNIDVYTENSIPDERSNYGVSKSMGEIINDKDITFRTSLVGPEISFEGTGLLDWFLSNRASPLQGWVNHYWNGITTLELAKHVVDHINNPKTAGLHNLVNNSFSVNKYELLRVFSKHFSPNTRVTPIEHDKAVHKVLNAQHGHRYFKIQDFELQILELKEYMIASKRYNKYGLLT